MSKTIELSRRSGENSASIQVTFDKGADPESLVRMVIDLAFDLEEELFPLFMVDGDDPW